jgi:hypothetical protein
MTGSVILYQSANGPEGSMCHGYEGYADIDAGTQVTVRDNAGTILATGSLGPGRSESAGPPQQGIQIYWCRFPIDPIPGITKSPVYTVEVSHRGQVNFSYEKLQANGWKAEMSLG